MLPQTDIEPSGDDVAASIRTHSEFEQYWAGQRQGDPFAKPPAPEPAPEPAPVLAQAEVAAPVAEYSEESWTQPEPAPEWEAEEPVFSGPKPSKKNAKTVVTWWEFRDGASGSRNYSSLKGGSSFPTGKSAGWGSRYVFSPYNGQYVDVKGLSSGTLVADPSYKVSERKYFLIP